MTKNLCACFIHYIFTIVCLIPLLAMAFVIAFLMQTSLLLMNLCFCWVFFSAPNTVTACETCFATEAIINDHSKHRGLSLAFHCESLQRALQSTLAFLMQGELIAVFLSVQSRHTTQPNVLEMSLKWKMVFHFRLISLLCFFQSFNTRMHWLVLFTAQPPHMKVFDPLKYRKSFLAKVRRTYSPFKGVGRSFAYQSAGRSRSGLQSNMINQ